MTSWLVNLLFLQYSTQHVNVTIKDWNMTPWFANMSLDSVFTQHVQFNSGQSLDQHCCFFGGCFCLFVFGGRDMRDDSAEILFQSFLQEALVSSPGIGRDVHSLKLSIQHFLSQPHRPRSKVPWSMVLERLSWHVTCLNHAHFRLLTVARRDFCGPTRKLILFHTQLLVLYSKKVIWANFLRHLVSKAWILFSVSKQGPCITATEKDGDDKGLAQLNLACKADGAAPPDPV